MEFNLTKIIGPSFYDLHRIIKEKKYTHYWLKGGRGSLKSTFWSVEIVLGILKDPNAHAICLRKIADTLKTSVYSQILWTIHKMGLREYFKATLSPMEITYLPTGQKIYFRGLDDPEKIKSIKLVFGYFKFAVYEELPEFNGMEEIRVTNQSIMRGGNDFVYFYTYNPPQNIANWTNIESQKTVSNRYVHSSCYLDVPREWLGDAFFIEADILKSENEQAYRHEYLGEATGTGLNVFTNVVGREITDDEIKRFDNIKQGIDWGFAVDPFVYGKLHFDSKRRELFIFDEIYGVGLLDDVAIEKVSKIADKHSDIIADSAEPKSIANFGANGIRIRAAEKGGGSINFGIKFLQGFSKIIIDPKRCPNAYREFIAYELVKNKDGTIRNDYPDKNNHTIDMVRYALEDDMIASQKSNWKAVAEIWRM